MRKQETPRHGLLIALVFMTSCAVAQTDITSDDCEQQMGCKECITFDPRCSWCSKKDNETLTNPMKRCKLHSENLKTCKNDTQQEVDLISNPSSNVVFDRNEPFSERDPNDTAVEKTYIQLKPQHLTVKLRKGQSTKVNVTFRKVIDYPLDIYYVMDLSYSMNDDLAVLQNLGTSLFNNIRDQVTKNVQLGFGSFVDKVMMPFTSTVPAQLNNPCESQESKPNCAPPFGFRHQLAITGNSTKFADAITATRISGNIDIPEGSFDALMQIAVCKHIKWRDGATRVILLTTDASPHVAMDGKLAAILEANDMKCHMTTGDDNETATYEKSKTMDYPSLGQLKEVFGNNKIHSIFAVTADVESLYKDFPKVVDDAYVATLDSDSSNIIPLINTTYGKLKGKLTLLSTKLPSNVRHQFRTFCPNGNHSVGDQMKCDGIEIGDEVVFELEFEATECPSNPNQVDKIVLSSSALQDVVTINLEYLCECDCQFNTSANSSECKYQGDLKCGLCSCHEGRDGSLCQCPKYTDGKLTRESCKMPGSTNYCEGRGVCECGSCEKCATGYTGQYCECQTTGCASSDNKVCGGAEKGICLRCPGSTEKCRCIGEYTIKDSDKTCTCHPNECKSNKTSDVICSGHGTCSCIDCICTDPKWGGKFCHECRDPGCTGVDATCDGEAIRKCAACRSKNSDCQEECPSHKHIIYSNVNEFPTCGENVCPANAVTGNCSRCNKRDARNPFSVDCKITISDSNCVLKYRMRWLQTNQMMVLVKRFDKEADCSAPNSLWVALPVTFAILVVGVTLLLTWKFYLIWRDKKNYELIQKRKSGNLAINISSLYNEKKRKSSGYSGELNNCPLDEMSSCNQSQNAIDEDKL